MLTAEHVMIDLETLGTSYDAAVIQIGAVTNNYVDFEATIDFDSSLKHGETSVSAMLKFRKWLEINSNEKTKFWAHSSFDFPILQNFHNHALGFKGLFKNHKNLLDLRTIEYFYSDHINWDEREGTHHNALDDAKFQMHHLLKMLTVAEMQSRI